MNVELENMELLRKQHECRWIINELLTGDIRQMGKTFWQIINWK